MSRREAARPESPASPAWVARAQTRLFAALQRARPALEHADAESLRVAAAVAQAIERLSVDSFASFVPVAIEFHHTLYHASAFDQDRIWTSAFVDAAVEARDAFAQAHSLRAMANAYRNAANLELAFDAVVRAEAVARTLGNSRLLLWSVSCTRAMLLDSQGRLTEASSALDEVIDEIECALRADVDEAERAKLEQTLLPVLHERARVASHIAEHHRRGLDYQASTPWEQLLLDDEMLLCWTLLQRVLTSPYLPTAKRPLVWGNVYAAAHIMGLAELAESALRALLTFESGYEIARQTAGVALMEMYAARGDRASADAMWHAVNAGDTFGPRRIELLIGRARANAFLGLLEDARVCALEAIQIAINGGFHAHRVTCCALLEAIDAVPADRLVPPPSLPIAPELQAVTHGLRALAAQVCPPDAAGFDRPYDIIMAALQTTHRGAMRSPQ